MQTCIQPCLDVVVTWHVCAQTQEWQGKGSYVAIWVAARVLSDTLGLGSYKASQPKLVITRDETNVVGHGSLQDKN